MTTPILKKYGFEAVLEPFIRDMNQLSRARYIVLVNIFNSVIQAG